MLNNDKNDMNSVKVSTANAQHIHAHTENRARAELVSDRCRTSAFNLERGRSHRTDAMHQNRRW